ncbi:MAG: hypothetical protein JW894_08760 [Bacteroidales bacterium]|nr:hypothetical protein [Bacteroidales bacterium]
MNKNFLSFLIQNIIATLILAALGYGLFSITGLTVYYHSFYPILLLAALIINLLVYYLIIYKKVNRDNAMLLILQLFAIKFFSFLLLAIVFLIFEQDFTLRVAFVTVLLILYSVYTTLEIRSIIKIFNSIEKVDKN